MSSKVTITETLSGFPVDGHLVSLGLPKSYLWLYGQWGFELPKTSSFCSSTIFGNDGTSVAVSC